jgi:hypothetical protein
VYDRAGVEPGAAAPAGAEREGAETIARS